MGMAVRDARLPGDEARKLFEKAIAAGPKIPNGHNQLGLMYLREEKWAEAAKAFEEAIKADPDWSNYHYNLGRALRGAGNLKDARDAFKRAIEIYQSHPRSQAELDELELREKGPEGEGPPKVDQTTVSQAYALSPNAGEAGQPRGRGKGSTRGRVKALRTSAGAR
jgi:tetratricopeptide (TPR) repeat protein